MEGKRNACKVLFDACAVCKVTTTNKEWQNWGKNKI
jgi:hypothetical protein